MGSESGKTVVAGGDGRLRSWKEIGRWFGVAERTAKRWEATRGLPVHRVPGDVGAAVFAFESELSAWLNSGFAAEEVSPPTNAAPARWDWRSILVTILAIFLLLAALAVAWRGWQLAATERQQSEARVAQVRQLIRMQMAEISDRLERQPGTVRMRADLVRDGAAVLARFAALPEGTPALRQETAEAYRRLAMVQNATDRPSLRDRSAARITLAGALQLVANDDTTPGRRLRARIPIDAARQAAADGAIAKAVPMLAEAAKLSADGPVAAVEDLRLAQSEIAQWQGNYTRAAAAAAPVANTNYSDFEGQLRRLRALDLVAEAHFYAGDKAAALSGYRATVRAAVSGQARWPNEPRLHWAVLRQQWNLGATLTDIGRSSEALPALEAARSGWLAMAKADPQDEAVASWVRTTRMSYGEALAGAGRTDAAVTELASSLADRRTWLAAEPANAERRRALIVGINALADVLAPAGRRGEACALYTESAAMAARMAAAGSLTGLDRDSVLKQLDGNRSRYCLASSALAS